MTDFFSIAWADLVKRWAYEIGFDLVGIARAEALTLDEADHLKHYLSEEYNADMAWLAHDIERRLDPSLVLPVCRSIVVVGVNYHHPPSQSDEIYDEPMGRIAQFARSADYHKTMGNKVRELARRMEKIPTILLKWGIKLGLPPSQESPQVKGFVDTGPVMEKVWAHRAGLGFIGKNTLLIHPRRGSYFLLGIILTTSKLDVTSPTTVGVESGCGTCTACLDACPTGALIDPGVLDSRRCLSYLTIEHRGDIPDDLKPYFTEWLFGCDVCQEVCPYNVKFASPADDGGILGTAIHPPAIPLREILDFEHQEQFLEFIGHTSPLRRAGLEKLKQTAELMLINRDKEKPLLEKKHT